MKGKHLRVGILFGIFTSITSAYSWDNHGLGTRAALSVLPDIQGLSHVKVESLEEFLQSVQAELPRWLEEEEQWARKNVIEYPARPDSLKFRGTKNSQELRGLFLKAIRVNPRMPFPLYLHVQPGSPFAQRPPLDKSVVTLLPKSLQSQEKFVELKAGEEIPAVDVISSASDEPDYGLDVGLWEDNGTEFGKIYGFGKQPFGNPVLEFSSQAPFHMGFFHEAKIVYLAASILKRTYPEFRIHLFMSLARHAFKKGHPYWGARFAGLGMHYIQDLTQPYHSTVLPGVSVSKMLWMNFKSLIGKPQPQMDQIQLVTNQHLALENYAYHVLLRELGSEGKEENVLKALTFKDNDTGLFVLPHVRSQVTQDSNARADRTSRVLSESLPPRLVNDPQYLFGVTEPEIDVLKEGEAYSTEGQKALRELVAELLTNFGRYSRDYFHSILSIK